MPQELCMGNCAAQFQFLLNRQFLFLCFRGHTDGKEIRVYKKCVSKVFTMQSTEKFRFHQKNLKNCFGHCKLQKNDAIPLWTCGNHCAKHTGSPPLVLSLAWVAPQSPAPPPSAGCRARPPCPTPPPAAEGACSGGGAGRRPSKSRKGDPAHWMGSISLTPCVMPKAPPPPNPP